MSHIIMTTHHRDIIHHYDICVPSMRSFQITWTPSWINRMMRRHTVHAHTEEIICQCHEIQSCTCTLVSAVGGPD